MLVMKYNNALYCKIYLRSVAANRMSELQSEKKVIRYACMCVKISTHLLLTVNQV